MELYFGNNAYNIKDNIMYESYILNEDEQNNSQSNNQSNNTYENALKTIFLNNEMTQKVKNLLDGTSNDQSSVNYDAIIKGLDDMYNACNTLQEFPKFV